MEYPDYFPAEQRKRMALSVMLLFAVFSSNAAEIEVTVLDRNGGPVSDVAVYVQSDHDSLLPTAMDTAVMGQVDARFEPHLLVVQTGTLVEFPNRDITAHHVYSFSKPNDFVLPMFKGTLKPRVRFDHEGVISVGCDLHDHMLADILVVDRQVFDKTGFDGKVRLTTDNTDGLTVSIWSPRIQLNGENLSQSIKADRSARITFSLTEKLLAPHIDQSEALSWNEN
jgi:plastocyanin